MPHCSGALHVASSDVSTDEGMGSLPDPHTAVLGRYTARDVKGIPANSVVFAQHGRSSVMLFDVDHNTKIPREKDGKTDIHEIVTKRNFDAEVAVLHHGSQEGDGSDLIYYDTDGDNRFDLVLFVASSGNMPVQAYRLVKPAGPKPPKGKAKGADPSLPTQITADPTAVPGRPYRTKSAFKDRAIAAKWKSIATKIFTASSVED